MELPVFSALEWEYLSEKENVVLRDTNFKFNKMFGKRNSFNIAGQWGWAPGAPPTYFNDGGVRQRFIFYTQKNPSVSLHQQILLFTFWKAKTCQLQLWFFNLVKNKTINCAYVIVDLSWWKIQYPKKSLCCFRDPKKIPVGQNVRPKKILRTPPSLKYVSGAPGQRIVWYNTSSETQGQSGREKRRDEEDGCNIVIF